MQAKVPVVPAYLEGLHLLMPKGTRTPKPGPALVRFGRPVSLEDVTEVPEGTERLRKAVLELAMAGGIPAADAAGYGQAAATSLG
jgi:1-acyl-sn-glycerol-3-phosphate acyltransferase